jgi:predicted  nucleic acid-binding Zn-ribbon protein
VIPALQSLIAVQELDTAADAARRRLAELPAAEKQLDQQIAAATAALEQARGRLADNVQARRELEKQVAVVDGRLARFDDHKAAVKTNQEFTALLHEIEVARGGKDELETQILALLEEADQLTAAVTDAEGVLAATRREADQARKALGAERAALEAEVARLSGERSAQTAGIDAALLAKYEQLLKQRRMVAVAPMKGDMCGACNVRLRPAVSQNVRRAVELVQCDSCQRILYPLPTADPGADAPAPAAGA